MNGITEIKPIDFGTITPVDYLDALMVGLGCSVSSMPRDYPQKDYCGRWEVFNPRKVTDPEALPDYWRMVYDMHNKPDMKDCRDLRYRYVHIPIKIMCQYLATWLSLRTE